MRFFYPILGYETLYLVLFFALLSIKPDSYQAEFLYKAKVYRNLCLLIQMGKVANIKEVLDQRISPKDFSTKQALNRVLSGYFARRGDYQKALTHYTLYQTYVDTSSSKYFSNNKLQPERLSCVYLISQKIG